MVGTHKQTKEISMSNLLYICPLASKCDSFDCSHRTPHTRYDKCEVHCTYGCDVCEISQSTDTICISYNEGWDAKENNE